MAFTPNANLLVRVLTIGCVTLLMNLTAIAHAEDTASDTEFSDPVKAASHVCQPELIKSPIKKSIDSQSTPLDLQTTHPIHIDADVIESERENKIILSGNAQIVKGNHGIVAEQITYNRSTQHATAEGDVVFYDAHDNTFHADKVDLDIDTFIGEAVNVEMKLAERNSASPNSNTNPNSNPNPNQSYPIQRASARAQTIALQGNDIQHLKNVTLTACPQHNNDVSLNAKEIQFDHAKGFGTAKSMTLRFKSIPIFYFPTATFPINDQRKTGFLFPSVGYADDSGLVLEAPYYLNFAPNYDATLTPRWLSRRGSQLFGKFRYLNENSSGSFRGEVLPSDNAYNHEDRHAFGFTHRQQFNSAWRTSIDWNALSDTDYLRDFSNDVDIIASSYIEKNASLDYSSRRFKLNARTTAYELSNHFIDRANRPYDTLPQLNLQLKPTKDGNIKVGATAQYTQFRHPYATRSGQQNRIVSGNRLRINPYIALPFERPSGYFIPKVSLQTIRYSLDDQLPANDSSPSVTAPVVSVDTGLYFERPIEIGKHDSTLGSHTYRQTLEPRLLYVNIPERSKQNLADFPNFDSGRGSLSSFDHFFRENRFLGGDRIGDTEQIALGLTSRIIDNQYGERLKLSLGKVFYFRDRLVGLPADTPLLRSSLAQQNSSGIIAEITGRLFPSWKINSFARWHGEGEGSPNKPKKKSELDAFRLSASYDFDSSHADSQRQFILGMRSTMRLHHLIKILNPTNKLNKLIWLSKLRLANAGNYIPIRNIRLNQTRYNPLQWALISTDAAGRCVFPLNVIWTEARPEIAKTVACTKIVLRSHLSSLT